MITTDRGTQSAAADPRTAGPTADRLVLRIVEAVAEATDVPVRELNPPLFDVVEPEAIEALCDHADRKGNQSRGGLLFEWSDCWVEVSFAGDVSATARVRPSIDGR